MEELTKLKMEAMSEAKGMKLTRVLLIEDEDDIRDLMEICLRKEGYEVVGAALGSEGLDLLREQKFDLILLDWMLPDQSGIEFLAKIKKIQEKKFTPVIMVTAKTETHDIVRGLESGAEDYITKPFELDVLKARIKAVLRRSAVLSGSNINQSREGKTEVLKVGDLEINTACYDVKCQGKLLDLTRSEFKLLVALVVNRGRVLTRSQLIDEVQGKGISVVDRAVDTHIFGLRKKLGECSNLVETIRGVGYRVLP